MAVIVGLILVLVAVLVGFTMAGGHVAALMHPSEFITIGGASLGALIITSPKKVLVDVVRGLVQSIKGSPYSKPTYIELFKLIYSFARVARKDGLLALDSHVSAPAASDIFQKHPRIASNHHATHFICSALSLVVDGNAVSAQLTSNLEEEIKVIEREHHAAIAALAKTADALPGFGIVAAVLGIVVTMQAIDGPVEEIGHKVGAALVGTFLGILLSYGLFAPLAGRMESLGEQEAIFLRAISTAVLAISEGAAPKDVVVRASRSVGTDCRLSPAEMKTLFEQADHSYVNPDL
jgi:chemotaxis protein MotA